MGAKKDRLWRNLLIMKMGKKGYDIVTTRAPKYFDVQLNEALKK